MTTQININCDMGESFGRWELGHDAELMPLVPTVNIACGFHGGDPSVMRRTVAMACAAGVEIGAHVGLPDLLGFGRRRLEITPSELQDGVTYQIGALAAFVRAEGGHLTHVKPHGSLYGMASHDPVYCQSVLRAVRDFDPRLLVILSGPSVSAVAADLGVTCVSEAFIDLDYRPDGSLLLEPAKQAWAPAVVASRALEVVLHKRGYTVDGTELQLDVRTLCLHGDAPNAVQIAQVVRQELAAANIQVTGLQNRGVE